MRKGSHGLWLAADLLSLCVGQSAYVRAYSKCLEFRWLMSMIILRDAVPVDTLFRKLGLKKPLKIISGKMYCTKEEKIKGMKLKWFQMKMCLQYCFSFSNFISKKL